MKSGGFKGQRTLYPNSF